MKCCNKNKYRNYSTLCFKGFLETFQKYFSRKGDGSDVPLISIQARTYPVEISYRDVEGDRDELPEALTDEVKRIHKSGEERVLGRNP